MRRRGIIVGVLFTAATIVGTGATPAVAHPTVVAGSTTSPGVQQSTSGDYATDVFGDPWDFSNDEDVPPVPLIGTENSYGITRNANGTLTVATVKNTTIKLVRTWGQELPWGRDGLAHPVDASRYTKLSMSMCMDVRRNMGVHFWDDQGNQGLIPFYPMPGCGVYTVDLLDRNNYPFGGYQALWAGKIIRLELLSGDPFTAGNPVINVTLDWVRLHRADTPDAPPPGLALPRLLTPGEAGGHDYATDNGNPFDFAGPDDVVMSVSLANMAYGSGGLTAASIHNDSYIELPLRTPFNPDRYHRLTLDVCYDGAMSFADAPGGGMNARLAWIASDAPAFSETQDIIIYPGCNSMTVDLATDPPLAVNDENTVYKLGWRGQSIARIIFRPDEDPGVRHIQIRSIRFADDASFSDTYPITFVDAAGAGGTADIYATTGDGYDGVKIASGLAVHGGENTFTWNGRDTQGNVLPNGTYHVWMTIKNAAGIASSMAGGPLRIERPLPPTPSYFVPINPVRILDTRAGLGGVGRPLGEGAFTEVGIAGEFGLPPTGITAIVMNTTVVDPTAPGFLTAWPSGEDRPTVASLNFLPGQTVPNLVSVKLGANGKVNIFNSAGASGVVADVMGYYTTNPPGGGGRFTPLTPTRILDTRDGTGRGGVVGQVGPGQSIDVPVTGVGGVPASGVTGVALNVTVADPSQSGFLTVWPTGEAKPFTATHTFVPNLTIGNLVLAKVGANGRVSIYNSSGTTSIIADVVGYFSAKGGAFVPVQPARLLDTRDGTGGVLGQVGPDGTIDVQLATGAPVPANATGVVVNVTSVNSSTTSYVTAWPTGSARPLAATMNPRPGVPVPNQAYLKLGAGGKLSLYNYAGTTDLIIDVFGYTI